MPPEIEQVDVVVIGAGQGGIPMALEMRARGRSVVLFEPGPVGGTCVNSGCTPSKAFLAAAHSAGRARRAAPLGVRASVSVDFGAVMERVARIVLGFRAGAERRLNDAGVELVRASAAFSGERVVTGGGRTFGAGLVIVDAGATASVPQLPGLAGTPFLDNVSFFSLRALPRRLAVLGGGYVGLELGQGMARCGSEVHVVHRGARVMEREEPDAVALLEKSLRQDGVVLHLGAAPSGVSFSADTFRLQLAGGALLEADALLVATGRAPNTAALAAERSGIALDSRGFIVVDDHLQTTCAGVFALGDAAGQPAFTHVAWEDHRRILSTLDGKPRKRDDLPLAYATYTEPQIARVGPSAAEARRRGIDAREVTLPLSSVARAIEWGQEDGFYRLVFDARDDTIVGATFVGYEAAELIHVIVAHMMSGATRQVLARSMHVHPTYAEGLPSLARLEPQPPNAAKNPPSR